LLFSVLGGITLNSIPGFDLLEVARKSRQTTLRILNRSKSPHIASCFSVIDILVASFAVKFSSSNRVDVLLSKGHAAAALYGVLHEFGELESSSLTTFGEDNSNLYGHVDDLASKHIPLATGSLGHGLPYAVGLSLAAKLHGRHEQISVAIISDGELDEGTSWESFLIANQLGLKNLIVIIDRNGLQSFKSTEETLALEPLTDKLISFGMKVSSVDGHDIPELISKIKIGDKPQCIIAKTIKGRGVSFMENSVAWHYRPPINEDFENAQRELG
jgi:transketolase